MPAISNPPIPYEIAMRDRRMAVREVARLRQEKNQMRRALQGALTALGDASAETTAPIQAAIDLLEEKEFNPEDYL